MSGTPFTFPSVSLGELLKNSAEQFPDRTAITFLGQTLTYPQLFHLSEQFALALRNRGFERGQAAAIMLPNCPQYLIALFGTAMAGGITVQVNPMSSPREFEHYISDSKATTLVIYAPLLEKLAPLVEQFGLKSIVSVDFLPTEQSEVRLEQVVPFQAFVASGTGQLPEYHVDPVNDVAVLQYTGGTTGRSKGAMLTHANLVANSYQNLTILPKHLVGKPMRMLAVIPFFHVYALSVCAIMGIAAGANLLMLPRFKVEEVIELVKAGQPHYFPAVPTMLIALLFAFQGVKPEGWSVDFCNIGSAPMPVETLKQFEELTGTRLLEGYGLSEASPVTHCNTYEARKIGSIGRVVPGTEAKIVDVETGKQELSDEQVGELVVRGPQVMKGYWGMHEETEYAIRDGFLYTGDLAKRDADGYYYIVDRKKDLILAGGFNVYPREIEEVLYAHPDILEAVVVGVPDAYRGETVKAFVVLKPGRQLSVEELNHYCRENLSNYKVPRYYEFRTELPKTSVGKILRRVLIEQENAK